MDDLPDKLRRNVVVLSAAIVAITVFHLSFRPTGTLLGFAEVGNVTPLKVWLALTAVLVYMFQRYWFDEQTDKERAQLVAEFSSRRFAQIAWHLSSSVEQYFVHQRPLRLLTDPYDLSDLVPDRLGNAGRPKRAAVQVTVERSANSAWQGKVRYAVELEWASGHRLTPLNGGFGHFYGFQFPGCLAAWIIVRCALRTATYSKGAVDTLVPIGLASVAFGICVFQLAMAGVTP
jgi:hypothetical protein